MRRISCALVVLLYVGLALAQQSVAPTPHSTRLETHLLPQPHTSVSITAVNIGERLDGPHWWNDHATYHSIYSHGEVPNVAMTNRDGTVAFKTTLTAPNLDRIRVTGPAQLIAKHSDSPNWSPDGNLLLFTSYSEAPVGENTRIYLQVFDFRTGKTSVVPSSHGIGGGLWIAQNTFVAARFDPLRPGFLTFDFKTQKWSDLVAGNFVSSWAVSPDGKYFYFTAGGAEPKAQRLRFADRQIETITSLKDLRRVVDSLEQSTRIDVAPDGSAIFARDIGTHEIYAVNVRWP